jgi:hypothetical protein
MLRERLGGESGQTLIFFAVLAPLLFAILGLAVEGGLVFSEYRHMQAAADEAALVGAQDLPNTSQAITDACLFSQNNGYDDCSTGGTSTTTVCVPPKSLSAYNGLNYQEGNTACANSGSNNYIEVQVQKPVQLFPIFAQYLGLGSFTLSAHAIARHGTPSKEDYAISILERTLCPGLTLSGSSPVVVVGPVISDCGSSNSISTGGSQAFVACNGQWLVSGPEAYPPAGSAGNLRSLTGGTAAFSPTDCLPSGQYDAATAFTPDVPPVPDPYCTSFSPPIPGFASTTGASTDCTSVTNSVSSMSNCTPCNNTAYYYEWTPTTTPPYYGRNTGSWYQATADISMRNDSYELFPGTYQNIKVVSGSKPSIYLNPGVYTIEGTTGFTAPGGNMCVYGAPACDVGVDGPSTIQYQNTPANCSSADMTNAGSTYYVPPSVWYYHCSPWGTWDANLSRPSGGGPPTTPPTFTGSTVPLNGVTFYFPNSGSFSLTGGNVMYLASPNPCPGTGTQSGQTVPFQNQVNPTATGPGQTGWPEPSGANGGQYTYSSTALPYIAAAQAGQSAPIQSPSTAYVYPNADLTLNGECERYTSSTYAGDVWQGEMPAGSTYQGQHLHFLVFARNARSSVTLNGGGTQSFFGILYSPGAQGCGHTCQMVLNGSASGGGGPPFVTGQIVANNAKITGHATVEVFYRPCDPTIASCGSGPGSGLVE